MNQRKAGAVLNYASIILNMVVGLVYTPFLLMKLGQSEYGLYSLASSIIAYLTVFDLGFGNAIVRYTAKFKAEGKQREQEEMFGMFLMLYTVIGLVVAVIGTCLIIYADKIFSRSMTGTELNELKIILTLLILNLAFTFPMSLWRSVITAYERFVFLKLLSIACAILNPMAMVVLLFMGYKAIALVVVTSFFNVFSLCTHLWYFRKRLFLRVRFSHINFSFLKEIAIYSFWVFLVSLTDQFYWSSGQFLLGIVQGTTVVAVFAVALQLKNIYYTFSIAISGVFLPRITEMVAKGVQDTEISDLFIRTGRIQYLIISFILTEFIILGHPFVCLWAGKEYEDAYFIAVLLFVATLIPLIQNLASSILMARNQLKARSLIVLGVSIVSLLISIPVSIRYGAIGCATTIAVAIIIGYGFILNIYYRQKAGLDTPHFWLQILNMSIVPAAVVYICYIMSIPDYVDNYYDLALCAMATSVVFMPLTYLFSMNQYERNLIKSILHKMLKI